MKGVAPVNWSEIRLKSSWIAVVFPMKVADIFNPRGGISQTAIYISQKIEYLCQEKMVKYGKEQIWLENRTFTLLGIHSTK